MNALATFISYHKSTLSPSGQFVQQLVCEIASQILNWLESPLHGVGWGTYKETPTRCQFYQMHLKSIPLCLYQHVYRIVSAGRVGHLAVLKTLPSKCSVRRGEERRGGSNAFAAKYQLHIHFTNNSSKIKTRLKFDMKSQKPSWGFLVSLEYMLAGGFHEE